MGVSEFYYQWELECSFDFIGKMWGEWDWVKLLELQDLRLLGSSFTFF